MSYSQLIHPVSKWLFFNNDVNKVKNLTYFQNLLLLHILFIFFQL